MFKKSDDHEWSRYRSGPARDEAAEHPDTASGNPGAAQGYPGATVLPGFRQPSVEGGGSFSSRSTRGATAENLDVESLIGEKTMVEGTFKAEGAIRVCGTVQGEIECTGSVFIDERARVKAVVRGASVTIAGRVEGQVHSAGKVEIRSSGHVVGDVYAGALIIQEGAYFDGTSRMAGGETEAEARPQPAGAH